MGGVRGQLLLLACTTGEAGLVRHICGQAARLSQFADTSDGISTTLHVACSTGKTGVVSYLLTLEEGQKAVNQMVTSYGNKTPLQCATMAGSIECIRIPIVAGADLAQCDSTGYRHTVLSWALHAGRQAAH